jgi:hypothetical protein
MALGFHRRRSASDDRPPLAEPPAIPVMEFGPPLETAPQSRPMTPHAIAPSGARLAFKDQASGTDARAERFFRQVRAEVDDLKKSITERKIVDHEFAELDAAAVAANPEAAALVPADVLVKTIIELHENGERLERRIAKLRGQNGRLRGRIRALKRDRAFERGRLETLDQVIEALHSNLGDLRLARDADSPRLEARQEPRVLRPEALAAEALPPAENA